MKLFRHLSQDPVTEDLPRKPDYRDRQYLSLAAKCAMGDIAAMMDLSRWHLSHARPSTQALLAEYEQALETGRNVDMLAVAEEYLNSGKTVFYAVGLAHLLADDGLVNTLRNVGYTVELVTYAG